MSIWREIRNHHHDEGEQKIYIDAYLTNDDWEEGIVIAKVDKDCRVEYIDQRAMTDAYAQEIISDSRLDMLAECVYELYKKDWCDSRGYKMEDYDEENGFNGESFVCFDEFCTNEFRFEDYMKHLLGDEFDLWLDVVQGIKPVNRDEVIQLLIECKSKLGNTLTDIRNENMNGKQFDFVSHPRLSDAVDGLLNTINQIDCIVYQKA